MSSPHKVLPPSNREFALLNSWDSTQALPLVPDRPGERTQTMCCHGQHGTTMVGWAGSGGEAAGRGWVEGSSALAWADCDLSNSTT
eukprot:165967-Chlamydomonas_euryale.AAC.3